MRLFTTLLLLAGCSQAHVPDTRPANTCDAGAWARAEHVLDVNVDGKMRRALVWFPSGPGPHDVVVNFHEFRSNPRVQVRYSKWADVVTEANVILVAPDAKYAVWNAGECCGRSVEKHVDDVAFLEAMMTKLDEVGCTSGRVMATGIGNGGMMAEMWACESDHPDAVVSVGGSLQWPECRNKRPIPMMHYHGSADTFIPLDGSRSGLTEQEDIKHTVDDAFAVWAKRNGAKKAGIVEDGKLRCTTWMGAAEMKQCVVLDGTDTWPGAVGSVVESQSPLADATLGALGWVREQWDKPAKAIEAPPSEVVPAEPEVDEAPASPATEAPATPGDATP